jgi:hypothetical protein
MFMPVLRQLRQLCQCVHRATTLKHMMKVGERAVDTHHPPFWAPEVVVQALSASHGSGAGVVW